MRVPAPGHKWRKGWRGSSQTQIWDPWTLLPPHLTRHVLCINACRPARRSLVVMNNAKIPKTDISKQGLNTIEDDVIRNNLMGRSRVMKTKEWRDASGQKGKVWLQVSTEPVPTYPSVASGQRATLALLQSAQCKLQECHDDNTPDDEWDLLACRARVCLCTRTSTVPTLMATHQSTPLSSGLTPVTPTSWALRA